jgi:hypothetical protein
MGTKKNINLKKSEEPNKKKLLMSDFVIIGLLISGLIFMYLFNKQKMQIDETIRKNNETKKSDVMTH